MRLTNLFKDRVQAAKMAAGILDEKSYSGPWSVQIETTNSDILPKLLLRIHFISE